MHRADIFAIAQLSCYLGHYNINGCNVYTCNLVTNARSRLPYPQPIMAQVLTLDSCGVSWMIWSSAWTRISRWFDLRSIVSQGDDDDDDAILLSYNRAIVTFVMDCSYHSSHLASSDLILTDLIILPPTRSCGRRYSVFQQKFLSFFSFANGSSRWLYQQGTFIAQKVGYV